MPGVTKGRAAVCDGPLAPDRCRSVHVDPLGELQVPQHISRIKPTAKCRGGWQVRYSKPSKFFKDPDDLSDAQAPMCSLEAAKEYLRGIWQPEPHKRVRTGAGYSGNAIAGVRLHTAEPHKNGRKYWVVTASHPTKRGLKKQFWIGSSATYTEARHKEAEKKAIEQRRQWLAEIGLEME